MQFNTTNIIPVLIIGAGPAGLATAGRLRHAGIGFVIIEQATRVGERWHHHYDRLHLHTVKQWSHLPHLPFPESYPLYVSKNDLITYFESYAVKFDIKPEFGTDVQKITKEEDAWKVLTNKGTLLAKQVILATGLNRVPHRPHWEGMELFNGKVLHSIDYRNAQPFIGKQMLVIGIGNTGAEIALDLANSHVPVWLSVRGPVNIVPRDLNGKSVQVTSKLLAKLPAGLGDWIGSVVQRLYFGNLSRYGLKKASEYPAVQLRKTGKTPVIDIGTVKAIKEGKIQVAGAVRRFVPNGVVLQNGETLKCANVILATGYHPKLELIIENISPFLDAQGNPKGVIGEGELAGLYFVGFDGYKLGGILGTINQDSLAVTEHLASISQV